LGGLQAAHPERGALSLLAALRHQSLVCIFSMIKYIGSEFRAECGFIYTAVLEISALTSSWRHQAVELRRAGAFYCFAFQSYPRWIMMLLEYYSVNNKDCAMIEHKHLLSMFSCSLVY
jgi:hypothetical protein